MNNENLLYDLRHDDYGDAGNSIMSQAADLIEHLQQRNDELAATVERLREDLKAILGWRELRNTSAIPIERIEEVARMALEATPQQNLNMVKREHFARGVEYVLEELTAPIPFNIDRVLNQQYPSDKDGE